MFKHQERTWALMQQCYLNRFVPSHLVRMKLRVIFSFICRVQIFFILAQLLDFNSNSLFVEKKNYHAFNLLFDGRLKNPLPHLHQDLDQRIAIKYAPTFWELTHVGGSSNDNQLTRPYIFFNLLWRL